MNATEAKALFAKHQIKFVLAQFVDIHGAAKAKAVPVEHLEMVLTDGAIIDIIKAGTRRANAVAEETLYMAKKAMKLDFGGRTLG